MDINKKLSELAGIAATLPQSPGVYKMFDKNGKIIYVGKSKALKNRVSQYFQNIGQHNAKTGRMVSEVDRFECVFTSTETEALVLENELIKLHSPKYNIKLKDDKSYPYICLSTSETYPRLFMIRSKNASNHKGDKLFGPYSSAVTVRRVIDTANKLFLLPTCTRKFPRDIGKERPCLNYHIKQCCGVCTGKVSEEDYKSITDRVESFLKEDYEEVLVSLEKLMLEASESLDFERAAMYRDIFRSVEALRNKQKILLQERVDRDIFGFWSDEVSGCLSILVLRHGKLIDSERIIIGADEILDRETFPTFVADYYKSREYIPHVIMVPDQLYSEELEECGKYLSSISDRGVTIHCPERGKFKKLLSLSSDNAREYVTYQRMASDKQDKKLFELSQLLSLEVIPEHIEAYDISNSGKEHTVAGMICVKNGKFSKKDYRLFNIRESEMDDYSAMREAIYRRMTHYLQENENGVADKKWALPDLILLDGGNGHVSVIKELLREMNIDVCVFGMVKDEHHKTRTLVDGENEVSISTNQTVFRFIYGIQEEIHRFTFKAMDTSRRKSVKHMSLEKIQGIGPSKAGKLMDHFKSISKIKTASVDELVAVKGISLADAERIREYFDSK
ncbi:MAG: excinuclease ABC subunit UvrC [Clostridia bacterium]|nr:excinuclease ABC subunit UvrC [Clostridia bacterium]